MLVAMGGGEEEEEEEEDADGRPRRVKGREVERETEIWTRIDEKQRRDGRGKGETRLRCTIGWLDIKVGIYINRSGLENFKKKEGCLT